MVIGEYPCCGAHLMIEVPKKTPAYFKENCPECGAVVWHRLSRIDPTSWIEADFLAEHDVDEETKQIKAKNE